VPMLLSVALLVMWLVLSQQQSGQLAQLGALEQEIRQLAVRPVRAVAIKVPVIEKAVIADNQPAMISALWEQLPTTVELSPRMMEIATLAQKYQIPLNVGDYQWQVQQAAGGPQQANHSQKIEQFDMRFAVQTDYVACRRFLIEVLRRYPTMALTELELRKNETMQSTIEATLTFSVFIRGGDAHAS